MPNLFVSLPTPVGNGVGASVNVSAMGALKTLAVCGSFVASINIEVSDDNVTWGPLANFTGCSWDTVSVACQFMRVRVSGHQSGAAIVTVGAGDAGSFAVVLPVPPGNGVGALIDTSTLGPTKSVIVSGVFEATVNIEISQDGVSFSDVLTFTNPDRENFEGFARFMRVKLSGHTSGAPVPVVTVAGSSNSATGPHRLAGNPDPNHILFWPLDEDPGAAVWKNLGTGGPTQTLIVGAAGDIVAGDPMPWRRGATFFGNDSGLAWLASSLSNLEATFPFTAEAWFLPTAPPQDPAGFMSGYLFTQAPGDLGAGIFALGTIGVVQGASVAAGDNAYQVPFVGIRLIPSGFIYVSPTVFAGPIDTKIVVQNGQPNHLAVTYDGAVINCWLNGRLVAFDNSSFAPNEIIQPGVPSWAYNVGALSQAFAANNRYHGMIWDVAISNIARNAAYFKSAYAQGVGWGSP